MKKISSILIFTSLILLLVQCRKEKEITVNAHFFSTAISDNSNWYLFVDGVAKGKLPKLASMPDCNQSGIDSLTLTFQLKSGKYRIVAKDSLNTIKSDQNFSFSENKTQGSTNLGGQSVSLKNDSECLMFGLSGAE